MITLEVCANSLMSALAAQKSGAIRVELCDNLSVGGTTPSAGTIVLAREMLTIQLNVLIRPRSGDFLYNDIEYCIMENDIRFCGQAGCNGVVFGILNADGSVDTGRNKALVDEAHHLGMSATFHRAIDRSNDLLKAVDDAICCGFDRILTSGGHPTALQGAGTIRQMIERAGNNLSIMPGGGITENNIEELIRQTQLKEFHGSFGSCVQSQMNYWPAVMNDPQEEKEIWNSDAYRIMQAIQAANR